MAVERWIGGTGVIYDPSAWSPAGLPQQGDTAVITSGTVGDASAAPYSKPSNGLNVFAVAQAGATPPTLAFSYWNLDKSTVILDNRANTAVMPFNGGRYFSNKGSMELVGGRFQLSQSGMPVSVFNNLGTISLVDADASVSSSGSAYDLANNGYLAFGGSTRFAGVIGGSGTTVIEPNAVVALSKAVINTQTVQFAGTSSSAVLTVAQPSGFGAAIANFAQGDRIVLAGLDSSYSASYAADGANAGTLTLSSVTEPTVTLRFAGSYQTSDFTVAMDNAGLAITTTRTDTMAPDPTEHDGRQVYRFFDTANGTHFYTTSVDERDGIPVTRSDMVYEGAVFRNADMASDPAAAPVSASSTPARAPIFSPAARASVTNSLLAGPT